MSLVEQARAALAGWTSLAGDSRILELADGAQRLAVEFRGWDRLGCEFVKFGVHDDRLATAPLARLRRISEGLSARLTYLLEPLRALEIDGEACVVQLRSVPPQKEEGRATYYELLVAPSRLSLIRYAKTPSAEREIVPAQVTREVFFRLVSDFEAAAATA